MDVASVSYSLDGVFVDTDNLPTDGFTWTGTTGDHNIVVTAYSGSHASGVAGPAYSVQFGVRAAASEQTRLAKWVQLADAPYAQFEGQGAAVNGKIYIFGGFVTGSLTVTTQGAVYDPGNDTWSSITDATIPLRHASHSVDGDWTAGPSLPADRGGGGSAILGRKLHYFGGVTRT